MGTYLKLNNILGAIVLLFGLLKLLQPIELLNVLGIAYYLVTAVTLFKKPKIGYVMLLVPVLGLILAYTINYFVNSY